MDGLQARCSHLVIEQAQRPTGADRPELAVIPNGAHHGPVPGRHTHELGQFRGGDHAHLIEDHHVPRTQLGRPGATRAVGNQESINGRGLRPNVFRHDGGRGRRGRQPDDVATGRAHRIGGQGQAGGLARAGRADPQTE